MRTVITVHPSFDASWPWAADHLHALWRDQGPVEFIRQAPGDTRPIGKLINEPRSVTRLAVLGSSVTSACLAACTSLAEASLIGNDDLSQLIVQLEQRGVRHGHPRQAEVLADPGGEHDVRLPQALDPVDPRMP